MLQVVGAEYRGTCVASKILDHTHITSKPRTFLHYQDCSLHLEEAGKCFLAVARASN